MLAKLASRARRRGDGRARQRRLPLPDASADVVTVAQALHWFDQTLGAAELAGCCSRRSLGSIWNSRDLAIRSRRARGVLLRRERVRQRDGLARAASALAALRADRGRRFRYEQRPRTDLATASPRPRSSRRWRGRARGAARRVERSSRVRRAVPFHVRDRGRRASALEHGALNAIRSRNASGRDGAPARRGRCRRASLGRRHQHVARRPSSIR